MRLVIISNRLSISGFVSDDGQIKFKPSAGGLATGLTARLKQKGKEITDYVSDAKHSADIFDLNKTTWKRKSCLNPPRMFIYIISSLGSINMWNVAVMALSILPTLFKLLSILMDRYQFY